MYNIKKGEISIEYTKDKIKIYYCPENLKIYLAMKNLRLSKISKVNMVKIKTMRFMK